MQGLGQTDFLKKFQDLKFQIQTDGFLYVHHENLPDTTQNEGFRPNGLEYEPSEAHSGAIFLDYSSLAMPRGLGMAAYHQHPLPSKFVTLRRRGGVKTATPLQSLYTHSGSKPKTPRCQAPRPPARRSRSRSRTPPGSKGSRESQAGCPRQRLWPRRREAVSGRRPGAPGVPSTSTRSTSPKYTPVRGWHPANSFLRR